MAIRAARARNESNGSKQEMRDSPSQVQLFDSFQLTQSTL